MPDYQTVRRVQHSPEKMYSIVADIERYPEFLPLCEKLTILNSREEDESSPGKKIIEADMTVGYKTITQTFRSKVILNNQNKTIQTTNIGGPFKQMTNEWSFTPVNDTATDIHFKIDYAFKNWALEKLMGTMFDEAFRTYAESFEKRADSLYK